jgi:hypothetical protein
MSSGKLPDILSDLTKFGFRHINLMEVSNIKFPASGSQADTSGQTDG